MASVPRLLPKSLDAFCRAARDFSVEALAEGTVADLVRGALVAAGTPRQRHSPLQPLFMCWFLLCRPLFPTDSLSALFARLAQALRGRIPGLGLRAVTDSALCHARDRLGIAPFAHLLRALAAAAPTPSGFHGFRVCALDGVRMDVADTKANRDAFDRPRSASGDSSWPQALLVVLFDVANRLAFEARVVSCRISEKTIAREILDCLSKEDLLLLDTGFYGIPFLRAVAETGARFLCPVPRHVRFRDCGKKRRQGAVLEYRAFMHARLKLSNGSTRVARMEVRVIEVDRPGHSTRRYVTNLPENIPASEIVQVYPERWKEEMAFDEIKTVLCQGPAGAPPIPLRSKSPDAVVLEAFALLCAHSIVRRTMSLAADREGTSPGDLSFTNSLRLINQAALVMLGAPAARLPDLYDELLRDVAAQTLRRPPIPRHCPRHVRRKTAKYAIKKPLPSVAA
jgi:hypothetical protein